ncbi:serine hydrolase [Comamonas thiooxydans]|uniref:Beta-lactamase n=1 Tax=Comamonas thiooxydans TaxID=363952 RepID=A0A0E3BWS1_9BURK|nr:serine hydrolase [Comamonas thiooxydans]KGH14608.1 beta-lactamase [Comamonas thiooxydans]KGH22965.1 beta-lactamase [Comamonas thiooxydans]KGH23537.1 beta-lactamase [Comamonas thiooxydans]
MSQPSKTAWTRRQMLDRTVRAGAGLGIAAGSGLALAGCGGDDGPAKGLSAAEAARRLPELAATLRRVSGVPGMAWAVVQGAQTLAAQGLGLCETGGSAAVNADTVFQLASVSKSLAATVVAHQVGQGRVSWDSRMQDLLPWFALRNPGSSAVLTVGDLFAHRSGLPDHAGDKLEELGNGQQVVLERLRLLPVKPLRSEYAYTNAGLTAAAVGVAGAANTDWASLSRQTLYAPLGMTRTTSVYAEFMQQANRASPHVRADDGSWQRGTPRNADPQSPAGGASSSVNDMARWLSLLLAQGRWQGQQLVAPAALQAAWQAQAPGGHYGFGFNVAATDGGLKFLSHSGAFMLGAATCFMLIPSLDAAVIVLTNGIPIGVPETLCRQFVDLMETGRLTQDWWSLYSEKIAPLMAPTGSLLGQQPPSTPQPPGALQRYAGSYDNAYHGPVQVSLVDNRLQLSIGPQAQTYVLRHWSGSQFCFVPGNESAAPHSISLAVFEASDTAPAQSLWLEFYDDDGLGQFSRRI